MKDDTFQWSFTSIIVLAVLLIILALAGVIPTWVIIIAIVGGIAGDTLLLYFWGKSYMSRY